MKLKKEYLAYAGLGIVGFIFWHFVAMGAALSLGFYASRKVTDSLEKTLALKQLDSLGKEIDNAELKS
jgi:hypothetical protein